MNLAFLGAPGLGAPELILIVFVLVLLFGAKKLPEMARGSGRALRIFKAETKGFDERRRRPQMRAPRPP
jgi:sec-independent protein translocase protein TatA